MNSAQADVSNLARPLKRDDYKTLSLSALGGALEFYDFIIFVFFATVLGQLFFPPEMPEWLRLMQTFGIFAAGYLARPLGGLVIAHFGDILGRKKMFTLSIVMMAVPTLIMGLLPAYAEIGIWAPVLLFLMRLIQGAAIGGEVPGAWVFVSEHVPPRHTGFACGTLTAGLMGGILLGSLVATLINSVFTPEEILDFAWRVPFLLGGGFGLVAVYLRRWLHETPVFTEMQQRKAVAAELPLRTVLRNHRASVGVSVLLTWFLSAVVVVLILMMPTLLQTQYGVSAVVALQGNSLSIGCVALGCVIAGALADRWGAEKVLIVGSVLSLTSALVFFEVIQNHPQWLFPLYALTGLFIGTVGAIPAVMVQAFPPAVRFTGLSFSYNLSYAIFGGLTPMIVTALLKYDDMAAAYYVALLCLVCMSTATYVLFNKRKLLNH